MRSLAFVFLILVSTASGADLHADIWQQVNLKNFDEAVRIMEARADLSIAENQFLFARVLAWKGDLEEAAHQTRLLIDKNPTDIDYQLLDIRLDFWRGRISLAGDKVQSLESRGIKNSELDTLSLQIRRARASKRRIKKYRLISLLSYSQLSNDSPDWLEQTYGVSYAGWSKIKPVLTFHQVSHYDIVDSQVALENYLSAGSHRLYANIAHSPYERLLPTIRLAIRYGLQLSPMWTVGMRYQFDKYPNTDNHAPGMSLSWNNARVFLEYVAATTFVSNIGRGFSNSVTIRLPLTKKWETKFIIAMGDELEVVGKNTAVLYAVNNYVLAAKYRVNQMVGLEASLFRHEQGAVYDRSGITGGITVSF